MKCPNCNTENPADYAFCLSCGSQLRGTMPPAPATMPVPPPQINPSATYGEFDPNAEKENKKALASLVLGLISIVGWWFPFTGFPLTICAIVFGTMGLKAEKRKQATAGLVLGVIFLIVTLINSIVGAVLGAQGLL